MTIKVGVQGKGYGDRAIGRVRGQGYGQDEAQAWTRLHRLLDRTVGMVSVGMRGRPASSAAIHLGLGAHTRAQSPSIGKARAVEGSSHFAAGTHDSNRVL